MANDSQIVRAKENLKLSNGGPSQRQESVLVYVVQSVQKKSLNQDEVMTILTHICKQDQLKLPRKGA